jgi:hypothetical protein
MWSADYVLGRLDKELRLSCLGDRAHPIRHFLIAIELRSVSIMPSVLAHERWMHWAEKIGDVDPEKLKLGSWPYEL